MTRPSLSAAVLCCITLLTACTIDAYEKGQGDLSLMTAELVDAYVGSDMTVLQAETDRGQRLTLSPPPTAAWITVPDTTVRALLYYKPLGDGRAQPVSLSWVGVLQPHDSIQGGMRRDPLHAESVWLSKGGNYLNLRLRLLSGYTDDEAARHILALVTDARRSTPTHAFLQLYHDQGGQPEYYSVVSYFTVPLRTVAADTVTITVNTYDGTWERTLTTP